MRTSTLITALLSASTSVFALPTTSPVRSVITRSDACEQSPADGRGATIFKQEYLAGDRLATDYTPIPVTGHDFCMDLSNIFGGWYASAHSLVVNEGYKCEFYTQFQCGGETLCLSGSGEQNIQNTLPDGFAGAIRSVQCNFLDESESTY